MIQSVVDYTGLELVCDLDDKEGLKDLLEIIRILNKNKVSLAGYDFEESKAKLLYDKHSKQFNLYLGR